MKKIKRLAAAIVLLMAGIFFACDGAQNSTESRKDEQISNMENLLLFDKLNNEIKEKGVHVYSISVSTENGISSAQIIEGNPCQNSYSVAKLFCVTAIGMLVDENKLQTSDNVADIFADEIAEYNLPRDKWKRVTIDNVLRHEVGFESGFLDVDCEDVSEYYTDDYLRIVLERPLALAPGEKYVYSDAAYYLISRIVTKISGEKLDDFLLSRLFSKIDCKEVAWSKCPKGYPIGATGLYLRSEEVAKLGRIYLDGGLWQGKRIISAEWVETVLSREYELCKFGRGYAKQGMLGQMIYINFDENVAVAWHAFDSENKISLLFDLL